MSRSPGRSLDGLLLARPAKRLADLPEQLGTLPPPVDAYEAAAG
ncbi:hypothetical protein ACFXKC_43850 [Streptomyces sp. NPDC059340]